MRCRLLRCDYMRLNKLKFGDRICAIEGGPAIGGDGGGEKDGMSGSASAAGGARSRCASSMAVRAPGDRRKLARELFLTERPPWPIVVVRAKDYG